MSTERSEKRASKRLRVIAKHIEKFYPDAEMLVDDRDALYEIADQVEFWEKLP